MISSSSSVVVTTTASRVAFVVNDPKNNDESMTKPRGYFADQFEVLLDFLVIGAVTKQRCYDRIEVITRHILTGPVQKYGGKRMDAYMHSSVEQVIMAFTFR
jgi:hypothetical protein